MTLAEKMNQVSMGVENIQEQIENEIVSTLTRIFTSGDFEKELERRLMYSKEAQAKREYPIEVAFWEYHEGCTPTNFRIWCFYWNNPENAYGCESHYYKGVRLSKIQKRVGVRLLERTIEELNRLGFKTSVFDSESWMNYYDKTITIRW